MKPPSPDSRPKGHLLRLLGQGFGVAVVVGGVIGSGIMLTPGLVASHLKDPKLFMAAWVIGGIYAFWCTVCVSELATSFPCAGGWYVYSRRAFGNYGGFLVGCLDWIAQAAAIAYLAVAFGSFSAQLQPSLQPFASAISIAMLVVLMLPNLLGLRAGSRVQELFSVIKAVALIAFVVACFVVTPHPENVSAAESVGGPQVTTSVLLGLILALQAVIISYDGWYFAIYFTEENREPAKDIPRSSILGVVAVIAVYLLVNLAMIHVLPMGRLATTEVAGADVAQALFGVSGKKIVLGLAMIAVPSALNATLLLAPRILFGMARDGYFPSWLATVNRGGTPYPALLLIVGIAIALILSGGYQKLIAISSFLVVTLYLSGFCALFTLRIREPNIPRPFKVWGYPWTNLGVLLASLAFLLAMIVGDLKDSLFTLVLITLSYPAYLLVAGNKHRLASENTALSVGAREGSE